MISVERKGASERSKFYEYEGKKKKNLLIGFLYTERKPEPQKLSFSIWLEKKNVNVFTHPSYGKKEKEEEEKRYSKIIQKFIIRLSRSYK